MPRLRVTYSVGKTVGLGERTYVADGYSLSDGMLVLWTAGRPGMQVDLNNPSTYTAVATFKKWTYVESVS